ncbi:alcohol oxidase-like protein [Hypoxylon sp. FL0890]|nr:alcohol oxidase-like protein [Hypoxylon sp. FL0890]
MGLYTKLPDNIDEVDVIIAGRGTAACVVASRLADADVNLSILVIEGGPNNYNVPTIINPIFLFTHVLPNSNTALFYKAGREAGVANREVVVPSGGVLGGGSSVNFLTYSRAQRSDFESWRTPGWSADEILPYLKRLETYHGPGATEGRHGYNGPVQVSSGTYNARRSENDFIAAANVLGYPEIVDIQDLDSNNGVQRSMRYISPDGKRQDTAHAYLHPRLNDGKHRNLHVLVESKVIRVLRSGIGNPEILQRAGVDVVASLPGVGENYSDHHLLIYPYRTSLAPDETVDGFVAGRNAMDVTGKYRPDESEVDTLGPAFRESWNRDFKDNPNKPLALMSLINTFPGDPTNLVPGQYLAVSAFSVYPYSRGSIHITGPGLDNALDFKTGFFSDAHDADIKKCVWAYKKQREIVRRMDVYRGEVAAAHPPFAAGSPAACIETEAPLGRDVAPLEYTDEYDAVLEDWLRQNEEGGVVDASLGVYGVRGLKIADLSIAPLNVAANTNNTAIAIGEKAADIFIHELVLEN